MQMYRSYSKWQLFGLFFNKVVCVTHLFTALLLHSIPVDAAGWCEKALVVYFVGDVI